MKINCKTNLDLCHAESWPGELPARPVVGDKIMSQCVWPNNFQLELEVVGVTWKFFNDEWQCYVELHIPRYKKWSITEFYQWYAPLVGRTVGAFI